MMTVDELRVAIERLTQDIEEAREIAKGRAHFTERDLKIYQFSTNSILIRLNLLCEEWLRLNAIHVK